MDVTLDGVEDIVTAMFNSTIIVYDGLTFEPIWNYTVPNSEVISVPVPGYYNDDDIPDFMVKHQIGSGYPTYYYTIATIIDGKTGKSLLEKPIEDSLSRQMSGLSVTVEGFGNDWFLYWSVDCLNYEGSKEKYQFLKNDDLISESRADLCKLRFNSTLTTNLYALSQHVGPPGVSLYFSEDWKSLEFNNSLNSKTELFGNIPFVSERSPKTYKSHNKERILKQERGNEPNILGNEPYETYGEYIGHKKLTTTDFQNDNADNFNNDYAWKNGNKWTRKNVQTSKDYDISYDGDSNTNVRGEQPMDYLQADEIREQRSNVNDKLINDLHKDIHDSTKNVINNESDVVNETNSSEQLNSYLGNLDTEDNRGPEMESIELKKRAVDSAQSTINNATGSTKQIPMVIFIKTVQIIFLSNSQKRRHLMKSLYFRMLHRITLATFLRRIKRKAPL